MDNESLNHQDIHPLNRNVHPHLSKATLFVAVVLGLGSLLLAVSSAQNRQDDRSKAAESVKSAAVRAGESVARFVEKPERGLVWAGLRSGKGDSLCGKLLEIVDKAGQVTGCTHGPDPAPVGVDIHKSIEPVRTGEADRTAVEATSSAGATASTNLIPCDGDGVSGKRIQALYVHASDVPSRYSNYTSSFQTWAAYTNNVFVESGLQTGGARNLRFVQDANCNVVVNDVTVSITGDDSFTNTMSELKSLGYNRTDRKYLLWVDANVYCGIGTIWGDDHSASTNSNNNGPSYARADSGCWGYAEPHEIMHNLGGVQLSAPHHSAYYHCTDESDLECYSDGTGVVMTYPCAAGEESHFDCNKDDYFYAGTPPSGNYLASHWNTAYNSFLIGGAVIPTPTPTPVLAPTSGSVSSPTPTPVGPDTILPVVTISQPADGARIDRQTTVVASATDNLSIVKMQIYIDGVLKASSINGNISYKWNSVKASAGPHTVTVKAFDSTGNMGQSSISVTK